MFCQESVELHDDGFEGSNDELRISQEVFYGNVAGFCNKRYADAEATKNETSICTHSESSAITNQASSKNICKEDGDVVEFQRDFGTTRFVKGSISGAMVDHSVQAKRMRLSMNELSNFKPYLDSAVASSVPVKQVVSGVYLPTANQILMCHVVESCRQGMTSSCYLLKKYPESDKEGDLGDGNTTHGNLSGSDGSELKQVGVCKSVASPISQESSATKLLVSSSSGPSVGESGVLHCDKRRLKRDNSPELENDGIILTSDSMKNSRALLRSRVLSLIEKLGWSTETRTRGNGKFRYLYRSPDGRPVREFRKVWNLCGQSLSAHGNYQMAGKDKQWSDFGQFWSDLFDTLKYIEERMDGLEPTYALACQWSLLDPFVILMLVDRKVNSLKAGKLIKIEQGNAIDVGREHVGLFKQGSETHNTKSIYVPEGNSPLLAKSIDNIESRSFGTVTDKNMHDALTQLPATPSDSTCLQYSSCLFDVPVGSAEVNINFGQSETLSPYQDSCLSSPSFNKPNLNPSKVNGIYHAGCSLEAENIGSTNKLSTSLFEHVSGSQMSKFKTLDDNRYDNSFILKDVNYSNDTHESHLLVQNDFIESQPRKRGRPRKHDSGKKMSKACKLKDDDLLVSAIIKKRNFKSCTYLRNAEPGMFKLKQRKKRKSHKGSCRLLPRSLGRGGKHVTESWSLTNERTVLSWLISVGALLVNEVIIYRDPKDDAVVKDGLITRDGILCKCCNKVYSVTGFRVHSGCKQSRPCLNLFMGSGRPYTLCQLQAWSAEYKARRSSNRSVPVDEFDKNDDSCGLCGDGGELVCCDNCPSTFHQSCLSAEELPEGNWYCLNCTCRLCEDVVNGKETSDSNVALKCSQCEKKYHQGCLIDKGMAGVGSSPWFCGISCEEIYGGLQSRVGLTNQIDDGYTWTLLRCIHDDQKVPSPQHFALKADCNSKLAVAVTIMEECFLSMTDPRTGIDMIPQVVYNWGSEFARLDYHGFYTAILEKNDVLVSVASIRVHGADVAEMPLIATCSRYRRQGMCRRLLNSIEKMLISLKVEKLVIAAIPDLVETWTVGFGFIPVEEDEKRSLNKFNLMVFPGTMTLKKTLYVNRDSPMPAGAHDVSPTEEPKMCGNAAQNSPEENAAQPNGKLTTLADTEARDDRKDGESVVMTESEPVNSSGFSKNGADDDLRDLQILDFGKGKLTKLPNLGANDECKDDGKTESEPINSSCFSKIENFDTDQNQHVVKNKVDFKDREVVEPIVEEPESRKCMETGAEPDKQSEPQGYKDGVFSLQKVSSDECSDNDLLTLAKKDDENLLSSIEQLQEASVLVQS